MTLGSNCLSQDALGLRNTPLSPQDSIAAIEVGNDGPAVELLAAEPLVVDPVEVAFDDAGRLWVVEMRDYPFAPVANGNTKQGRIRILEDADADGIYDRATVFAEALDMPTGLALWKDGAVVTLAGQLVWLRDRDGDLRSDATEVWIDGFSKDNEQLRANHPRLGPDGWWYIACGLRGGDITPVDIGNPSDVAVDKHKPIRIGSRDVRLRPATGQVEVITGPAQFGLSFDSLGMRYFCSNRNPAVQVMFEQADLERNPLAGFVPSVMDVLPAGAESRVFPMTEAWTTSNLHAGQFTAACGVFLKASGLDPSGQPVEEIYVCEPTGNLVKKVRAVRSGPGLEAFAEDLELTHEWLASRDNWFRPVNICQAPNGDVVVVDMHRAVIEHPRWVPEELKQRPDERWGNQAGRIYCLTEDASSLRGQLLELGTSPLSARADPELIVLLAEENAWLRRTAFRLLLERHENVASPSQAKTRITEVLAMLRQLSVDRNAEGRGRLTALSLLAALGEPLPRLEIVVPQNSDNFLQGYLRITRQVGQSLPTGELMNLVVRTRSRAVLFEALLCLARAQASSLPPEVWERVVASADPYLLSAAASAIHEHPDRALTGWLRALQAGTHEELPAEMLTMASQRFAQAILRVSTGGPDARVRQALLRVFGSPSTQAQQAALAAGNVFFEHAAKQTRPGTLISILDWPVVAELARSLDVRSALRREAVLALGFSDRTEDTELIVELIGSAQTPELSKALLKSLNNISNRKPERFQAMFNEVVFQWLAAGTPSQIGLAIDALLQTESRRSALVKWIEEQPDRVSTLRADDWRRLKDRNDPHLKSRIETLLSHTISQDRQAVIVSYRPVLDMRAGLANGKAIFQKSCAACHRIDGVGNHVGPDISDSRTKTAEQLLVAILDPNAAIDNNYYRFAILTVDDEIVDGVVTEESRSAITVVGKDAQRRTIRRDAIVEMRATGVSMMPEGIENEIDKQGMADLIAYIKNWRYQGGAVPVANTPE